MRTLMLLCAVLALMWVMPLPARTQAAAQPNPVTFVDLLGGKTLPLSLQLKELDGEWRSFTTGGGAGGIEQFYMMAMNEGMPTGGSAYYTRGRTITVGTETFLVAYRQNKEPFDFRQAMMMGDGDMPEPEPLTPETTLQLSLLNLRTLGTLQDITPFNLDQIMNAGKEQMEARQRAKSTERLEEIAMGIMMFANDNDETLPELNNLDMLMDDLMVEEESWKHPVTGEPYQVNAAVGGMSIGEFADPTDVVLCFEATPWPDGKRGVAFLDGHSEFLTEAEWAALKKNADIP